MRSIRLSLLEGSVPDRKACSKFASLDHGNRKLASEQQRATRRALTALPLPDGVLAIYLGQQQATTRY
jgi:hypothetical protein